MDMKHNGRNGHRNSKEESSGHSLKLTLSTCRKMFFDEAHYLSDRFHQVTSESDMLSKMAACEQVDSYLSDMISSPPESEFL